MFEQYRATREQVDGTELCVIASWGRDGWDLGEWPYVKVHQGRTAHGDHIVSYYVEGDRDFYITPDDATRNELIDWLAWFHWNHRGEVEGTFEDMPAERRGPFSWARLDAERVR